MKNEPTLETDSKETTAESFSTDKTLLVDQRAPIIIIFTILLMIILGGLYYWHSLITNPTIAPTPTPERPTAETNKEPESTTAKAQTDSFGALSTSDEITAIEADLESTNLDTLELELNAIEAELETTN